MSSSVHFIPGRRTDVALDKVSRLVGWIFTPYDGTDTEVVYPNHRLVGVGGMETGSGKREAGESMIVIETAHGCPRGMTGQHMEILGARMR